MTRKLPEKTPEKTGAGGIVLALAAAAALAIPGAGLALPSLVNADSDDAAFTLFTPAGVDPQLARRVNANMRANILDGGIRTRFTPTRSGDTDDVTAGPRTVTVAVRVDEGTARAISVRKAIASVGSVERISAPASARRTAPLLSASRYDLGVARGYQNFAKTPKLAAGVRDIAMPDLSEFRPDTGSAADRPSRFQPRIALEMDETPGRSPRTLAARGEQSVDVSGAYRVTRNLDVTAGVRLSQDNDRLAPLSDSVQDDQAVYVGTQFRF
ncbi:MAG: hypothetical protein WA954_10335 [Parerythrobacter sp.]